MYTYVCMSYVVSYLLYYYPTNIIKICGYCNNFVANAFYILCILQSYNCSDAAKLLQSKYAKLSNLSYSNMSGSLYANEVITQQEKLEIQQLIGKSQMERVLDIVIASLKVNQTAKYKGFLLAMENSDDGTLNTIAQELGE